MIRSLPLSQVAVGMYIVGFQGNDQLGVKQQGLIQNEQTLRLMEQLGVISVLVDTARSKIPLADEVEAAEEIENRLPVPNETPVATTRKTGCSYSSELPKAQKLYKRTLQLHRNTIKSLKHGENINVAEVEKNAENFIDSVFRNPNAMSCVRLLKDKDDYLLEHAIGVTILMVIFARHLGYDGQVLNQLCVGSLLHDIGKVRIPDHILHKPGRLNEAELVIMQSHALYSREILMNTPGLGKISLIVAAQHHEKLDGSGYPFKLKGDQVSRFGRMIAICDIYDALTADRVYRDGMTAPQALKIINGLVPNELDGESVREFINCIGIYPVGSFVELTNGVIARIEENNKNPLKPVVKFIYSIRLHAHVTMEIVDLSAYDNHHKIVRAVRPEEYRLQPKDYL